MSHVSYVCFGTVFFLHEHVNHVLIILTLFKYVPFYYIWIYSLQKGKYLAAVWKASTICNFKRFQILCCNHISSGRNDIVVWSNARKLISADEMTSCSNSISRLLRDEKRRWRVVGTWQVDFPRSNTSLITCISSEL